MVNLAAIVNDILLRSYKSWLESDGNVDLSAIFDEMNLVRSARLRVHQMIRWDLRFRDTGPRTFAITAHGFSCLEREGLIPEEVVNENRKLRVRILETLAPLYESEGAYANVPREQLAGIAESEKVLHANIDVLAYWGFIIHDNNWRYRINLRGLDYLDYERERRRLVQEFESLSGMPPQQRGRELQRLLARVLEQNGWKQEEAVRTPSEEMDVIISREREYYLLECKWERKPIGAPIIREFYGKLSNRADVRGIVVSMSGFAKTAVKQVEDYANAKLILLFGNKDTRSMIQDFVPFERLLNQKYDELVKRRRVIFS